MGLKWTFTIAAICGFVGVLITFFFAEFLTCEELAKKDE